MSDEEMEILPTDHENRKRRFPDGSSDSQVRKLALEGLDESIAQREAGSRADRAVAETLRSVRASIQSIRMVKDPEAIREFLNR